jgi:hypothetical protein
MYVVELSSSIAVALEPIFHPAPGRPRLPNPRDTVIFPRVCPNTLLQVHPCISIHIYELYVKQP